MSTLRKAPVEPGDGVEELKKKFGEDADAYAETRGEAAELAGETRDAERWEELADKLREERP